MLETYLINCCAPTLASLKSGSLFNCKCTEESHIEDAVSNWNARFNDHGIKIRILRRTDLSALIYVYRSSALARTLSDPDVLEFLDEYGYSSCSDCNNCGSLGCNVQAYLEHLASRIAMSADSDNDDEMSFPHEIGVFLDYPLSDVKGFIEHKGKNSKYTGLWKVYGDTDESMKRFEKFRKCSSVYSNLWESGRRSIHQLTVAG